MIAGEFNRPAVTNLGVGVTPIALIGPAQIATNLRIIRLKRDPTFAGWNRFRPVLDKDVRRC